MNLPGLRRKIARPQVPSSSQQQRNMNSAFTKAELSGRTKTHSLGICLLFPTHLNVS